MVGGAGYAAGKHMQRRSEHEAEQDAQIQEAQQAQAPAAAAEPAPQAVSEAERMDALKKAKDLFDSGVLNEEQFEAEKAKLLGQG